MFWKKKKPKLSKREKLLKEARENTRAAREAIGEEKLDRLAAAMMEAKKEKPVSPMERAEEILIHMNKEKVGDHLLALIREKSS